MKANQKYLLLSLAAALATVGLSFGAFSSAQTVTPLTCSSNVSSVAVNQPELLTAMGGNGTYAWSGQNFSPTVSSGTQFSVGYSTPGTYPVTVSSGGETATCNVTVAGTVSTAPLTCYPSNQNVTFGQTATVSATGGNGTYTWSSNNAVSIVGGSNGSSVTVDYATLGPQTMTVVSGGLMTDCAINVVASSATPPTTPGLPDTGSKYGG